VIEKVPIGNLAVLKIAVPDFTAAVPITVPPFLNITAPDGASGAEDVTVEVNCTLWPNVEGLRADVTEVVVGKCCTTCCTRPELGLKFESPAKAAAMVLVPRNAAVVNVAIPPDIVPVPSCMGPVWKIMVSPSGMVL
jgi:hypothetical protein